MGWLIALILMALWLNSRHDYRALLKVCDLLILQKEIGAQRASGRIAKDRHDKISLLIDGLLSKFDAAPGKRPENETWRKRRDAGWELLLRLRGSLLDAAPPWRESGNAGKGESGIAEKGESGGEGPAFASYGAAAFASAKTGKAEKREKAAVLRTPAPGSETGTDGAPGAFAPVQRGGSGDQTDAAPESSPPLSLVEIIEMVEAEAAMSGESEIHAADVVESRPERTPPREKTMMA
ncbi:MAG: hypothetical protein GY859_20085, partial [Desulfobacterales bacterium]|nr:hypothetical protein [Desulfobacterales bacterium]